MLDKTIIMSSYDLGWSVYRVHTESSDYHLGVFHGAEGRRACTVLRGTSDGRTIDVEDCAPLVGGRSLFDVPRSEWIGKQLAIGTATTSPIRSVEAEGDAAIVTSITGPMMLEPSPYVAAAAPRRSPYPEDYVERVQQAAGLLRRTQQKAGLLADLRRHPELLRRFQVALADCLINAKAIGDTMTEPEHGIERAV